jgi:hypothetical protein
VASGGPGPDYCSDGTLEHSGAHIYKSVALKLHKYIEEIVSGGKREEGLQGKLWSTLT